MNKSGVCWKRPVLSSLPSPSPEPSCGIQGVGRGFSSRTFLLRAAKPLTSLPSPLYPLLSTSLEQVPLLQPRSAQPRCCWDPPAPPHWLRHHPGVCFSYEEWKVSIPGMCRPAGMAGKPGPAVARRECSLHLGRTRGWQGWLVLGEQNQASMGQLLRCRAMLWALTEGSHVKAVRI